MNSGTRISACALLVAHWIGGGALLAQDRSPAREASALRIADIEEPEVDGFLNEAIWSRATPIGELVQVEPRAGVPPTERSDIRIIYSTRMLYIGARFYDSNPEGIRATQMERDARLDPDDRVEILLDTFLDRRNAYWFQIAPLGGKGDGLIANNGRRFNKQWDTIWYGRSRISSEGWVAEIGIPFRSISFNPDVSTWGFNVRRMIRRKNESARWETPSRDINFFQPSAAGVLTGIVGIEQGIGLDVVPGGVATYRRHEVRDDKTLKGEPTLDVRYRITPDLTGVLTFNTDFAETEVDERRVNLTRFPLFFPEKRDFFLEDASIFEFGFGGRNRSNIPFFSRRIGLGPSGAALPLQAGVKIAGRQDSWNVGALAVRTGPKHDLERQDLVVGRVARNIFESSEFGVIATHGDPSGYSHNSVFGVDFRYDTTEFLEDKSLVVESFWLHSFDTDSEREGASYGLRVDYPNDLIEAGASFEAIDKSYHPALGFVRRRGTHRWSGDFEYKPRPDSGIVRQFSFGVRGSLYLEQGNSFESSNFEVMPLVIEFQSSDRIRTEVEWARDRLEEDFEIYDDITIQRGTYEWTKFRVDFDSSDHRPFSGRPFVEYGEFYDGHRFRYGLDLTWRPSSTIQLSSGYSENIVDLHDGDFTTRVTNGSVRVQFDPDVSWTTTVQWDNGSDILGLNSRLRWILEPGSELFLVANQNVVDPSNEFRQSDGDITLKAEYTFRF